MTTVFVLWFFLVNGAWQPGSNFEGWGAIESGQKFAAEEVDKKMASCELGQAFAVGINDSLKSKPEGEHMDGIGTVHGVTVACFKVTFPGPRMPVQGRKTK
jgi:hypothetical protein